MRVDVVAGFLNSFKDARHEMNAVAGGYWSYAIVGRMPHALVRVTYDPDDGFLIVTEVTADFSAEYATFVAPLAAAHKARRRFLSLAAGK